MMNAIADFVDFYGPMINNFTGEHIAFVPKILEWYWIRGESFSKILKEKGKTASVVISILDHKLFVQPE